MSSINALLNLGNSDYYNSLTKKKPETDETNEAIQQEQQNRLQQQALASQVQESGESQRTYRRLQQIEQEIEKLSLNQAQLLMQMVGDKIAQSTARQLGDIRSPIERGILAPAYI